MLNDASGLCRGREAGRGDQGEEGQDGVKGAGARRIGQEPGPGARR